MSKKISHHKHGKKTVIAMFFLMLLLLCSGCSDATLTEEVTAEAESMLEEIPENVRAVMPPEVVFEYEQTKDIREMNAALDEEFLDLFERDFWYFSYPGNVEEALEALELPVDAIVMEVYEKSIVEEINNTLHGMENVLEEAMGSEWLAEANLKAEEWKDQTQTMAEVVMTPRKDSTGEEVDYTAEGQWFILIASPAIDLDSWELLEESLITLMRVDYQF